jgi:LEA14-like dessication related protein
MKKILPVLLIAITIFFSGCKVQPVVPTGIQDIKFGNIDPLRGIVAVDLGLKINNPNKFAITIYAIDLDITMDGVALGKVMIADKFKIEKNKEEVYRVKVTTTLTDVIHSIPKILDAIAKKESKVEVSGFIKVGSGLIRHTFIVSVKQDKVQTGKN